MTNLSLLERLGDRDLEFLAPGRAEVLRRNPDFLPILLDDPTLFRRLAGDEAALVKVSPFLLFHVLLRQALRELGQSDYTLEWSGPRRRVPVFDADSVRAVLAQEETRDYLAELLASFTRVYSGSVWRRTRHGLRRWRFSELDPRSLRRLLAVVDEQDRFFVERRLGDVLLFLTGVFQDTVGRAADDLEGQGADSYRRAAGHPLAQRAGLAVVLRGLADRFHQARKALNFVADRYLYPFRASWFTAPSMP